MATATTRPKSVSELLLEYGSKDDRVCYVGVDTIDAAFAERHPERVIDVGIAEQNEMAVAAGMAAAGMTPIVNAVTPFSPLRNYDQIRTVLARHNGNVKIIARALGLQNISHGATHHDYESLALYLDGSQPDRPRARRRLADGGGVPGRDGSGGAGRADGAEHDVRPGRRRGNGAGAGRAALRNRQGGMAERRFRRCDCFVRARRCDIRSRPPTG